jgi:hypothetical protein
MDINSVYEGFVVTYPILVLMHSIIAIGIYFQFRHKMYFRTAGFLLIASALLNALGNLTLPLLKWNSLQGLSELADSNPENIMLFEMTMFTGSIILGIVGLFYLLWGVRRS